MRPKWIRSEFEVRPRSNRSRIDVEPKWDRCEVDVKQMGGRSELEVRPKWNRSDIDVESKWPKWLRSETEVNIDVDTKWDRDDIELKSIWNRCEIEVRPRRDRSEFEVRPFPHPQFSLSATSWFHRCLIRYSLTYHENLKKKPWTSSRLPWITAFLLEVHLNGELRRGISGSKICVPTCL